MAPNPTPPKEPHYWGPTTDPFAGPGIDKWKGITMVYDPQPNEACVTGTQSNALPYEEPKKAADRGYYARIFGGKKRRP